MVVLGTAEVSYERITPVPPQLSYMRPPETVPIQSKITSRVEASGFRVIGFALFEYDPGSRI